MGLSPQQRSVVQRSVRRARKRKASPRERKALLLAEGVESNYNDDLTAAESDRDSTGALQQRPSQGWGPATEPLEVDVDQFLAAAKKINRRGFKGSAGQLAQAVQRSAFPGRYDERSPEVERLLRQFGADGGAVEGGNGTRTRTRTETVPGVDRSADRRQLLASYLLSGQRHQPGGLLELKQGLDATPDTPSRTKTIRENVRTHEGARKPANAAAGGGANSTTIRQLMRVAQRDFGLTVRENSLYDKVDPVHAEGSYHYRKTKGGGTDAAADISGPPEKMAAFARYVARRHGKDVEELIWRGRSARTIKRGKPVPASFFTGHQDHVHVADVD